MKRFNKIREELQTLNATLSYYLRVANEETERTEMYIAEGISDASEKILKKDLNAAIAKNREIWLAKKVVEFFNLTEVTKKTKKEIRSMILKKTQYVTYDFQPVERIVASGKSKEAGAKYVYRKIYWADAIEYIVREAWCTDYEAPMKKEPTRCVKGTIYGDYDRD